ncbi:hypothetical protein [Leptospira noguchii]|nr:hypothetical protein [Leptospira noguchii]
MKEKKPGKKPEEWNSLITLTFKGKKQLTFYTLCSKRVASKLLKTI